MHHTHHINIIRICTLLWTILTISTTGTAQQIHNVVQIHFKRGQINVDTTIFDNKRSLTLIKNNFDTLEVNNSIRLEKAIIIGSASPEGSINFNDKIAIQRAGKIKRYIKKITDIPDSAIVFISVGPDWLGLKELIRQDNNIPHRADIISILDKDTDEVPDRQKIATRLKEIKQLHNGRPYDYIDENIFPHLRTAKILLTYNRIDTISRPADCTQIAADSCLALIDSLGQEIGLLRAHAIDTIIIQDTITATPDTAECDTTKRIFTEIALKTNLLLDAFITPNIGIEFNIDKGFTIGLNLWYAWWNSDRAAYYHRTYGIEIESRYYITPRQRQKPMRGHHIGIYFQTLTYDMIFGPNRTGYISNQREWNYGAGISYGYSLPVHKHIDIDFTIGVGYLGGPYSTYHHHSGTFVRDKAKHLNYFGPTKAGITFKYIFE